MAGRPYDVVVVGAGIVGLATSLALVERFEGLSLAVLEKEPAVGTHQTGRNSGVIHSGIYYRPGSLKARLCREGAELMEAYCDERGVPRGRGGKVIVATDPSELPGLEELHRRGTANGVPEVRMLSPAALREVEPHASGIAALHVPTTGVTDFGLVAAAMARDLSARGVRIETGAGVVASRREGDATRLLTGHGAVGGRLVVNCAGLYADVVARRMGVDPGLRIVPFRGEYHHLRPGREHLVNGLVYPVPDPRFPFLGVHFTKHLGGDVGVGPNAVLAFAREGYTWGTIRPRELWDTVSFRGTRAMARRYWRSGLGEYRRSLSRRAHLRAVRRLVPEVGLDDLLRGGAGVRAQAVLPDGGLVDDFHIVAGPGAIHVLNVPSPAATASLAIGRHIADLAAERLVRGR